MSTTSEGWIPEVGEALVQLADVVPGVKPGKMFGYPALYTEGKLCACAYGDGIGMKLPAETVAALLTEPGFAPFQPYGKARMREWVHVHAASAEEVRARLDLLQLSVRFVAATARRPPANR